MPSNCPPKTECQDITVTENRWQRNLHYCTASALATSQKQVNLAAGGMAAQLSDINSPTQLVQCPLLVYMINNLKQEKKNKTHRNRHMRDSPLAPPCPGACSTRCYSTNPSGTGTCFVDFGCDRRRGWGWPPHSECCEGRVPGEWSLQEPPPTPWWPRSWRSARIKSDRSGRKQNKPACDYFSFQF